MPGKVERDIGARYITVAAPSIFRIDGEDGHGLGGDEERQRVVDGAGRLTACVPADHNRPRDIGPFAGVRYDQHRSPDGQRYLRRRGLEKWGMNVIRIELTKDDQI